MTFVAKSSYPSFTLEEDTPAVKHARKAAESIGLEPTTELSNGGLDANWLVKHGVATVTFGSGQAEIHTVNETWTCRNTCRVAGWRSQWRR